MGAETSKTNQIRLLNKQIDVINDKLSIEYIDQVKFYFNS